jgi:hypothetical protein
MSDGVWMDIILVAVVLPGVTEAGAKLTIAPVGNPVAVRTTGLLKGPPDDVAVMLNCAFVPG